MTIIGHGVDLVEVERIRSALDRHGDRFANRIYTRGSSPRRGPGRSGFSFWPADSPPRRPS